MTSLHVMGLRKTPVSVIFERLYFILTSMVQPKQTNQSAKATASLVTGGGLILVWAIIWTNFPSKDELLSAQSTTVSAERPRQVELDLTIPGVPRRSLQGSTGTEESSRGTAGSGNVAPQDSRARQIAEVRCDAHVQEFCPDSLTGDERRRCVTQRMRQFDQSCQQIVRQRMIRWKAADGYRLACSADATRMCQTVEPGEGRILACLQEHEQDLSEACYQSLLKGRLHFRN
ncbi:MAG: cysteine rich repeat-containing protein [Nitrospira sp.]|nr:cysteine rich repeat-containing protein [Nitrospira sp.]MBK9948221.1 cysteine rich repeat-containing protein [Nitrospira sp.]